MGKWHTGAKRDKYGNVLCPHERRHNSCVDCHGVGICTHNRQRNHCKECSGTGICEHARRRNQCRDCGGSTFCKHGRRWYRCQECGGFIVAARGMFAGAKARAKKRNIPFDLTIKDILELIGKGICPVFGTSYTFYSGKICDTSATIDRFIPHLGYVKSNCLVISELANKIKSNAIPEQVRRVADWMESVSVGRPAARQ
jgi:hypothetical protein